MKRKPQALPGDGQVVNKPSIANLSTAYIATITLYIVANYVLLVYGFHFGWKDATLFIVYFSVAWIVGVVTVIMPAGIGIREAVFIFLATQFNSGYSFEPLVTVAVVYRFWQLFQELGAIALGLTLRRVSR